MARSDKQSSQNNKNQSQNHSNTPRRTRVVISNLPPGKVSLRNNNNNNNNNNNRRSEALRSLQERVSGLRVPNFVDSVDNNNDRNVEPVALPIRNTICINTNNNTPMDPE